MTIEGGGAARAGLIARVKGILLSPKAEWEIIDNEPATAQGLYTGYVMIIALIPAIVGLLVSLVFTSMLGGIMGGLGGVSVALSPVWAVLEAVKSYVLSLVMIFVMALIIENLAPNFGGVRDRVQALKVAAYAATAVWVSCLALVIPLLGVLVVLAGAVYSAYLIYLGLRTVMKSPEDKAVLYAVLVIVLSIVAALIINLLVSIPLGMVKGLGAMASHQPGMTLNLPNGASVNLNKMEKAAKQMEAAAENMQVAANGGTATINTGATTSGDVLQALLPTGLPGGFTRTETSSEGMSGVAMAAEGVYTRGDSRIELNVADMGALGAMAGAVNLSQNRTTQTGYEKIGTINGRMTTEKYDRTNNSGEYGVMVGGRFMVQAEGDKVTIDDLKTAVGQVPFNRLEAMAKG